MTFQLQYITSQRYHHSINVIATAHAQHWRWTLQLQNFLAYRYLRQRTLLLQNITVHNTTADKHQSFVSLAFLLICFIQFVPINI